MTRETKIGLLVGLAFIIVIGILLSDHLTSSNEPPQAALAGAGNSVRQAINTPGGAGSAAPVTVVTPVVTPQQPVATQSELTPGKSPVQIVRIGPAKEATKEPTKEITKDPAKETDPAAAVAESKSETHTIDTDAPVSEKQSAADAELAKVAAANGEPVVPVSSKTKAGSTYTAQPGDSVSKIASRLMGSSNKANIAAFVKANPTLQGDPAKLMAGRAYKIPAAAPVTDEPSAAAVIPVPPAASAKMDADDAVRTVPDVIAAKVAADTVYLYTVKPGDNLTKIARDQLGSMEAVASIQELNHDKLKGAKHDLVLVGMKIRLPGKPLAKAE